MIEKEPDCYDFMPRLINHTPPPRPMQHIQMGTFYLSFQPIEIMHLLLPQILCFLYITSFAECVSNSMQLTGSGSSRFPSPSAPRPCFSLNEPPSIPDAKHSFFSLAAYPLPGAQRVPPGAESLMFSAFSVLLIKSSCFLMLPSSFPNSHNPLQSGYDH